MKLVQDILISLIRESYSNRNNNKKISMNSKVQIGQGDLIEVILTKMNWFPLAKNFPAEITIQNEHHKTCK